MTYTDQDVERVAQKIYESDLFKKVDANDQWLPWERLVQIAPTAAQRYRDMAQTAVDALRELMLTEMEAMEREPLEDVIHDLHPGTKICHVWPLLEGGYEAEIGVPVRQDRDGWWDHKRSRGEGATIDEAIRAAVAAAKGDE